MLLILKGSLASHQIFAFEGGGEEAFDWKTFRPACFSSSSSFSLPIPVVFLLLIKLEPPLVYWLVNDRVFRVKHGVASYGINAC